MMFVIPECFHPAESSGVAASQHFFPQRFHVGCFFLLLLLLFKGAVYILSNSHCKCRVHEGRLFFSSGLGFFFRAIIFTLFQSVFL